MPIWDRHRFWPPQKQSAPASGLRLRKNRTERETSRPDAPLRQLPGQIHSGRLPVSLIRCQNPARAGLSATEAQEGYHAAPKPRPRGAQSHRSPRGIPCRAKTPPARGSEQPPPCNGHSLTVTLSAPSGFSCIPNKVLQSTFSQKKILFQRKNPPRRLSDRKNRQCNCRLS